jgi:hypothetical protein
VRPHILILLLAASCTTHRLPPLPPERDPTSESAPVAPYRAPPDVLTTELNKGAPEGGHEHHHGESKAEPEGGAK